MTNDERLTKREGSFVICAFEVPPSLVPIHVIPSEVEGSRRATFKATFSGPFAFAMLFSR